MDEGRRKRTRRERRTRPSVLLADRIARLLITLGGIGTIAAVSTLCVFLVWVVVPLFLPARSGAGLAGGPLSGAEDARPFAVGLDEHLTMGWSLVGEGELHCFRLRDGARLASATPFEGGLPATLAVAPSEGTLAAGFEDGTVRLGSLGFSTRFLGADDSPPALAELAPGASAPMANGMVERTGGGQLRLQELTVHVGEPLAAGAGVPLLVDHVEAGLGPIFATFSEDDVLHVSRATRRKNLLTGVESVSLAMGEARVGRPAAAGAPRWLLLSGLGDNVFLLWEDGTLWRCDTRNLEAVPVVEKTDLLPEEGVRVTAACLLIGRTSLAVGDSLGRVRVWFRTKPVSAGTLDGAVLAMAHELVRSAAHVSALAPSARGRMLAAGYGDGGVSLFHVTSQRELASLAMPGPPAPVEALALGPKDDALLAASRSGTALWRLSVPHPETSLAAIFRPVWYEGLEGPEHVWQSSSGTDDFEPKYGLMPLVFGTVKATFYSLLFGVPIALLAALYSSEFLHPRRRARVKPTIEMMASLPSVVLGFLSALVIAPLVEDVVPGVLVAIVALPFWVALGGHLWRALPPAVTLRYERWRLAGVALCLTLGVATGGFLGPVVERLLFGGDLRLWLAGGRGGALGGWMILLLPAVAAAVAWLVTGVAGPRWQRAARRMPRARFALLDLLEFLLASLTALLLLAGIAALLAAAGLDARGGFLDTYVQRNALVVGFVMGFAIIPIVYTIAEDALAAVPDDLRAASLGAGATTWQTAARVVVPTAMSGIFSAIMIGFGRAVGETMIVLMAAGNTPVMDWNVFNGFRTLSANIAVELPEAVQGSTHYRMLFLAALVLFGMTFVLNTAAEAVRLRYRKRRLQL
jgi:phosphate transport system permease protein